MNVCREEIWVLITRMLSGEATPAEEEKLIKWLDEDPKHRAFYHNIKSSWQAEPDESMNTFFFDYEKGKRKLRQKLSRTQDLKVNKAKTTVYNRRIQKHIRVIAASILFICLSPVLFCTLYVWEQPELISTYATSDVEQRIITLDDGSVLRLNRNSCIEIHQNNSPDKELVEVYLQGEAFFDVAENPERSFAVHINEAVVEVLGTSFNVKGGDEVMVAVDHGTVNFRSKNHDEMSSVRLVAGQLGLLSRDNPHIKVDDAPIDNYLSWMNGYLKFDNMPFDQVILQLGRIYDIDHELIDASIGSYHLTVYTDRMQMEEVLENIELALGIAYSLEDGKVKWVKD